MIGLLWDAEIHLSSANVDITDVGVTNIDEKIKSFTTLTYAILGVKSEIQ